jgi:thiamine-monophosphate kinase
LTPAQVGARAVAAALSDLAAMGARAEAVLIALVVPDRWRDRLADVADGIASVVGPTGARIIGGNLSSGQAFGVTTTVIGSAERPVPRRGALAGDRLLVTGLLGGPGQALAALEAGGVASAWAMDRFADPRPRLGEGEHLGAAGVHAMLDVSDGLVADARHLAAASGVHLRLDASRLPRGPGVTSDGTLESGEEYELLLAAPPEVAAALLESWASLFAVPLTDIGEVVAAHPSGLVEVIGRTQTAARVEFVDGHDHFTR